MNALPPSKAKFILCDDIREEASGKMAILGLYADDQIFVYVPPAAAGMLPPGAVAAVNQMCVACIMIGGHGSLPATAEITDPSGQIITRVATTQHFKPGQTSTLALKGASMLVPAFGTYKCKVVVARKAFPYSFNILAGPAPGQVIPTVAAAVAVPAVSQRRAKQRARRHK